MESVGLPDLGVLLENSENITGSGRPETSTVQVLGASSRVLGSATNRHKGWIDSIGRTQLRKRVLHDIAECDDEEGATRLIEKLSERIRTNARGSWNSC